MAIFLTKIIGMQNWHSEAYDVNDDMDDDKYVDDDDDDYFGKET